MTVEPTPTLSAEDAYRLTQRIRTFGVPIDVDRPDSQISRTLAVR